METPRCSTCYKEAKKLTEYGYYTIAGKSFEGVGAVGYTPMKTTKDETMTHEDRYMLVTGGKEEEHHRGLTLYEAMKLLTKFAEEGKLTDITHVRPMFGSNEQEKFVLLSWA